MQLERRPKNYWKDATRCRAFFDYVAKQIGFDPSLPENWYHAPLKQILSQEVKFLHPANQVLTPPDFYETGSVRTIEVLQERLASSLEVGIPRACVSLSGRRKTETTPVTAVINTTMKPSLVVSCLFVSKKPDPIVRWSDKEARECLSQGEFEVVDAYRVSLREYICRASSGIGRATAEAFLKQGDSVALVARNKEALEEVHSAYPSTSFAIIADVSSAYYLVQCWVRSSFSFLLTSLKTTKTVSVR